MDLMSQSPAEVDLSAVARLERFKWREKFRETADIVRNEITYSFEIWRQPSVR